MSVHKNEKNGTWYVMVRYTDWQGNYKQKCKRGFATRRDAQEWEKAEMQKRLCDTSGRAGMGKTVPAAEEGGCKYDAGKLLCPLRGRS